MWKEIHVNTTEQQAEVISDELLALGAKAITFLDAGDQPIYEPPTESFLLWKQTTVVGLFEDTQLLTPVFEHLKAQQLYFHIHEVPNEDWVKRSLDSFEPLLFGKHLWIVPSWHVPKDENAINVMLDPGLAFGTGTHPTTGLCLTWLENHIRPQSIVIDYGCGSGILGIAALKLGAKQVFAVDNDPQALTATQANGEINQFFPPKLTVCTPHDLTAPLADLIIANILAKPLIELAPYFATLVKSPGNVVLSGILASQVESVLLAYQPWFYMETPVLHGEWARLVGSKIPEIKKA